MAFKIVDSLELKEGSALPTPAEGMVAVGVVDGRLVGSDSSATRVKTGDPITIAAPTVSGGVFTVDINGTDRVFKITPTANASISVVGAVQDEFNEFIIQITNGGAYALTYPTGTRFSSGTPPELSNPGTDMLAFNSLDGGTTWNCIAIALGLLDPLS
jgi:hypothetical protein